jgi:Sulfotransferase domain
MGRKTHKITQPTRVLFVGGYGRSGSTIIDLLLDRVPGITAVGEFRHLFGRALGDNELCSCGKPFNDCKFWGKVLAIAFPEGVDRKLVSKAFRAINKVAAVPQVLYPSLRTPKMREYSQIYRQSFAAAYKAVVEVSNASVIVDSTKYPLHGLFLSTMPEIDLVTMLLVRDPRAVAYSWERRKLRPEVHWEKREMPRHNVTRSALAWNLSNSLTRLMDKGDGTFRLQRYEDFLENPLETIKEIASFALDKDIKVSRDIFTKQTTLPHSIAGNPIRIGSETIQVRPDNEWKKHMDSQKQALVAKLCALQMRQFGYRVKLTEPK